MSLRSMVSVLILCSAFVLSGCVVRTYEVTKDRVDQDLSMGNRGYLMGQPPTGAEAKEKKMTRQTHVVEIELRSPLKFEKLKKAQPAGETGTGDLQESGSEETGRRASVAGNFQQYTVQKGDTLQKISQKFYGTTKKWPKIFDANSEALKGPNKIYPGQVLNIPVEGMKETEENLK
jgi:nucleoid-associated protein YgaU